MGGPVVLPTVSVIVSCVLFLPRCQRCLRPLIHEMLIGHDYSLCILPVFPHITHTCFMFSGGNNTSGGSMMGGPMMPPNVSMMPNSSGGQQPGGMYDQSGAPPMMGGKYHMDIVAILLPRLPKLPRQYYLNGLENFGSLLNI